MRRLGMIGALVAMAMIVAACGGGSKSGSGETGAGGWSRDFEGTELRVLADSTLISRITESLLPQFEEETGIKVVMEQAPYDSLVQKSILDFNTHRGGYDLVTAPSEYLGSFVEKGYVEPIDDFLDNPEGTGDGYDQDDLVEALWKEASEWKDHYYGLPSNSAVMMMFYRKDLFENDAEKQAFKAKYGYDLGPAKTLDQYRDIAEFFTRDKGEKLAGKTLDHDFYGVTLAGKRHTASALEWLNYAWIFGGDIFDEDGQPALDSTENVEALTFMKDLTAFAPPGFSSATWDEVNAAFQQDTAAQAIQWSDLAGGIEDPASSKVVGKAGYADIPVKTEGDDHVAHVGPFTYVINKDSKNQDAAKLYMAWTVSQPIQMEIAKQGGVPVIASVFEDPELTESLPYWRQQLSSLEASRSRPRIPEWGGISDLLSVAVSSTLSGQTDPQGALDKAQGELEDLMKGSLPVTYQ